MSERAWILLPSGRQLDLLDPDPWAWTDDDLAIGLSRTYRWAGYSAWDLPLSVAQHSLTVLTLRRSLFTERPLTDGEARRELLHDATEALMGGWDPITPLKPHLGPGFSALVARLQEAIDHRYELPAWTAADHALHKRADRLAAANEAYHVVGWSRAAMLDQLGIELAPLENDPLDLPSDQRAWEPWPPKLAQVRFLRECGACCRPESAVGVRGGDSCGNCGRLLPTRARPVPVLGRRGDVDVDAISALVGLSSRRVPPREYGACSSWPALGPARRDAKTRTLTQHWRIASPGPACRPPGHSL